MPERMAAVGLRAHRANLDHDFGPSHTRADSRTIRAGQAGLECTLGGRITRLSCRPNSAAGYEEYLKNPRAKIAARAAIAALNPIAQSCNTLSMAPTPLTDRRPQMR